MTPREKKILALLRDNPMVSSASFVTHGVGFRYGSALKTMRDKGFVIETIPPREGPTPWNRKTYWYTLKHDPECRCDTDGILFCRVHGDMGFVEVEP